MTERDEAAQIAVHVEVMATEQMRKHACTGHEGDHDLPFQVFRYLSGYDEALTEIQALRERVEKLEEAHRFVMIAAVNEENVMDPEKECAEISAEALKEEK